MHAPDQNADDAPPSATPALPAPANADAAEPIPVGEALELPGVFGDAAWRAAVQQQERAATRTPQLPAPARTPR